MSRRGCGLFLVARRGSESWATYGRGAGGMRLGQSGYPMLVRLSGLDSAIAL